MDDQARKPGFNWALVAVFFALSWCVYLAFFLPRAPDDRAGKAADFRWTLRDLDDAPVDFGKYKGRPIFLNIWATWCPPCVAEMPSIARLAANPRLKDVAFVCVSTDESAGTVREFLKDKGWTMTVLRATNLPEVFATEGIPATFLIAPDGRIAFAEVGAAQWDTEANVKQLEGLAGERAGGPVRP